MSKMLRGCLIGILGCLSFFMAAQAANALTVSPSGAYTARSSGSTFLRFSSNGQTLTCTSSQIGATIQSNGSGTSPVGSAVYGGCSNSLLGNFTVTQTSAWGVRVLLVASPLLVGLDVSVPARGARIVGATGCTFTVSGSVNVGRAFTGPLPVAIATSDLFSVLSSGLTTDSVSGCSPALTVLGLGATYAGSYGLNRPVTVSG